MSETPTSPEQIERTITLSFPASVPRDVKMTKIETLNRMLVDLFGDNRDKFTLKEFDIETKGLKAFYSIMTILKNFAVENIMFSISYYEKKGHRGGEANDSDVEND